MRCGSRETVWFVSSGEHQPHPEERNRNETVMEIISHISVTVFRGISPSAADGRGAQRLGDRPTYTAPQLRRAGGCRLRRGHTPVAASVSNAEAGRPHCGLIAILLLAPAAEGTGRGTAIAVGEQRR
jgi:hypothetical protein